ncbi:hypothetical protein [Brevibacillus reuszeri]|uniref:hypothetical protein n=1 Tax=Brevibacillus reuszeri TaxID=54915 RepID=UPI000CCC56E3|nr:hypothetical protein [Brevibacillus reuszeri]
MNPKSANEYVTGAEGIVNRNTVKGSPSGEVITYYLTEEERLQALDKYGPILKKRVNRQAVKQTIVPQITKEQYLSYKQQGLKDGEILKLQIPGLHSTRLVSLKIRWGLHQKQSKQ